MSVNKKISQLFYEIADYLEMNDVPFKPVAYRRAAREIDNLPKDLAEIYQKQGEKGLLAIEGIGNNLSKKIVEYLETGKISLIERLKKEIPVNLEELNQLEGLGPKKIKVLYQQLGVYNLKTLEKALLEHKVANLFGFGKKTEDNLLKALKLLAKEKTKFSRDEITPVVNKLINFLKQIKEVKRVEVAGSFRRKKKEVGDIDLIVLSDQPNLVMKDFINFPDIVRVWAVGSTKASVRLKQGIDVDLRVFDKQSFGAGWLYFTGSKDYNIFLRRIAQKKGFKLNEYGLYQKEKRVAGETEKEIYEKLGLSWIPPEKREV